MEWMKGTQVKISFKRRGWVQNVFQNGSRSKLSLSKSQHRTWKLPAMHTFRYVRMIAHYLPSTSRDRSISCPHARTNQNMPPILLTMFQLFLPVFYSSFPLSNSLFSRPFDPTPIFRSYWRAHWGSYLIDWKWTLKAWYSQQFHTSLVHRSEKVYPTQASPLGHDALHIGCGE